MQEETGWDVSASLQSLDLGYSHARDDELRDRWDWVYGPDVREVEVVSFAAEVPVGLDPTLDGDEHDRFGWFGFVRDLPRPYRCAARWQSRHKTTRFTSTFSIT